jgi:sterol desaturase/sphingolipid hydroxylase (fatty acid hydroxylase superfamily)
VDAMTIFVEFLAIFAIVLVLGYLAPAGAYYWLFHVHAADRQLEPIQHRRATAKDIRREVLLSLSTCLIFALMSTALYQLYKAGHTSIYWNLRDYPYGFLFLSVFAALAVHDTWFYWTHRFMHWRPVFKYTHLAHHRSVSPTPWAIYAFQPAEAFLQFLGVALVVIFVPLHPLGLLLFFWIDAQINTAGHTGYELVPRFIARSPWFQGLNTVTHHDLHHTHPNKNFGSFFNVWDRWMGTYLPDEAAENHGHLDPVPAQVAEHSEHETKPRRNESYGGLAPHFFARLRRKRDQSAT